MTTANKPAVKALVTTIAAALCTHLAYAATPTAVWDCAVSGQELNTAQGGLTISAGAGNSFSNGKLAIASSGTYSGGSIDLSALGISKVSVLVKYSNFAGFTGHSYFPVFMCVRDSNNHELGLLASDGSTTFSWYWYTTGAQTTPDQHRTGSPAFVPAAGYALFSYDAATGLRLCSGTALSNLTTEEKGGYNFSGRTLTKLGLGGAPDYQWSDGWPSLVIEKVALFSGEYLTATDVADYKFPSLVDVIESDVTVSALNTKFGTAQEINVYLADGVTVTGDTTFNASTVHFICDGSFNMTPPANNEATFDFAQVTGRPVLIYGALPAVSGTKFTSTVIPSFVTDPTKWTGVIYISSASVTDFTSNTYGNESSVVRLGNVSGWLRAPSNAAFINTVPVELAGTLTINNGNSANDGNPNRCTVFKKLSGSGTISADSSANRTVVVIQDASEFTGGIGLNYGKHVVFGEAMPEYATLTNAAVGTIFVMEGARVTVSGFWWATGGIKVDGELCAPNHASYFGGGTTITTSDSGVFTLLTNSNVDDMNTDYSKITGTGTLRLEGSGYRCISTNNFPTAMTVDNRLTTGFLHRIPGLEITIGSLAGDGYLRSDWGGSAGDRDLRVLQAKDTTWSGKFWTANAHRFRSLIVAPGATTSGTLTISATHEAAESTALTVESGAKVNLTGTWVGATTVNGTISGTGTVNGALTLANGSTLAANTADPLEVSSLTTTGTVTIGLADSDFGKDFIRSTGTIDTTGTTFAFTVNGEPTRLSVIKTDGGLKAVLPGLRIILR